MGTMKFFMVALVCAGSFQASFAATTCIKCSSKDDESCGDEVTANAKNVCTLDETNTECVVYQYIDNEATVTVRDCAPAKNCSALNTGTYKGKLSMCNECTGNKCNVKIDTDTAHNKCIICEDKDETKCGADTTTVADTCTLDDTVNTECVVYKYLDTNKATITARGCAPANNCATLNTGTYKGSLSMCNECTDDKCNVKTDTNTAHIKCIQCEGKGDSDCATNAIKVTDTCLLDDTIYTTCLAYKYFKVDNGKPVEYTFRGCGTTDAYDTQKALPYTKIIAQCSDKDQCNSNFGEEKESTICISCSGDDCKDDIVTLKDNTQFCKLDSETTKACIAYKEQSGTDVTYTRSCDAENKCSTLTKDNLLMCNKCTKDNCNINVDTDTAHNKCIKCEDKDETKCGADTTTVADTCTLDDTVNTECVVYKYLDTNKATITGRGCAPANNCATLNTGTYKDTLSMCNECTEDKCNVKTDTNTAHIKCIQCEGKSDSDCATNATKITDTCLLDDTISTTCLAYKYFKVDNGKPVEYTFRGCGSEKDYETQKGLSYTKIINKCSNKDRCNSDFDKETENIICIACSGDDCKDDPLTLKDTKLFCKLDSTANKTCIAYKYQDKNKGTVTVRDCAPANNCATLNNGTYEGTLSMCNECTDDLCNVNTDTNSAHNKCIKCEDKTGSDCANNDIDTSKVTTTCSLDDTINLECVAYRYIKGENIMTYRGCAPENDCTSKNNKQNTKLCNECDTDNCNAKIDDSSEKKLCIKCDGDDCNKDDVVPTDDSQYCNILANNTCIAYKYLKKDANSTTYYRGCEEKDKGCEYLNKKDNFKLGTMQGCYECNGDDLCNRNINGPATEKPETTTAGAPSIVSFNIYLLPLVVATFIAYIV